MKTMGDRTSESMTATQREALAAELAELEGPKRAEIVEAIATARGFGDLSENFAYHDAKNEQGLLERRIAILRHRVENAVVVEEAADGVVGVGSVVEVEDGPRESSRSAPERRVQLKRRWASSSPSAARISTASAAVRISSSASSSGANALRT
jgi:transcription elongation GreA/GreB family factor